MAIQVTYNESKTVKTILDDQNPRIYQQEFKCKKCGEWVAEEETLWVNPKTGEASTFGAPYHEWCAPAEKEEKPGLNIRYLVQGMIKIAHEDLPAGFFDWSLEKQIKWSEEYFAEMDDHEIIKGVDYLTPIEDVVIDQIEVDGSLNGEEYPVLASTKAWVRWWAGGRDEVLRSPEEVTKAENLTNAAPKLLAACKLALETYQGLAEKHGIECDAIPLEDAIAAAEGRESYHEECKGFLIHLEKCEDCVHGEPQDDGGQAICTCPESTEGVYAIRDILYRTGTCPFYAWKH